MPRGAILQDSRYQFSSLAGGTISFIQRLFINQYYWLSILLTSSTG